MARTSHRTSPFTRHFIRPCGNIALSFWLRPCKRTPGPPPSSLGRPLNYSAVTRGKSASSSLFHRHAFGSILFTASKPGYHSKVIFDNIIFKLFQSTILNYACLFHRSYVINYCNWNRETSRRKVAFFVMNYSRNLKSNFTFGKNFEKGIKMLKFYESKICTVI